MRGLEVAVARIVVGVVAVFTVLVLLWRFGFVDAIGSLPPPITLGGWNGFSVYPWARLALILLIVATLLTTALFGKRGAISKMTSAALVIAVFLGALVIYFPLADFTIHQVDRVRGSVQQPMPGFRFFVTLFAVTLMASGVLIAVARAHHTPDLTRRMASAAAVVTTAVYLHLFWICTVFPFNDQWSPAEWERADLLRPVRHCRGVTLWQLRTGNLAAYPIGSIDDLWLNFADPRSGGRRERAISYSGSFVEGYFWLTLPEAAELRVRADDPALANCDGTWRREDVRPATWHKVGLFEP